MPEGRRLANTWPGPFPARGAPGPHRYGTSPVGTFPAARHPEMEDSATTNVGFRCVVRDPAAPRR